MYGKRIGVSVLRLRAMPGRLSRSPDCSLSDVVLMSRMRIALLVAALLVGIGTWGPAPAHGQSPSDPPKSPHPILFVHGLNSSSETWTATLNQLSTTWEQHVPVNDASTNGHECHAVLNAWAGMTDVDGGDGFGNVNDDVLIPGSTSGFTHGSINQLEAGSLYTINFNNFWNEDPSAPRLLIDDASVPGGNPDAESPSNQAAIIKSGYALRACIDQILTANPGTDRVILVGHSMGGLAAREYLQRTVGVDDPGTHHVAKLVTIGTPHRGSNLGSVPFFDPATDAAPKGSITNPLETEAVRDLRYNFSDFDATSAGPYLFGGTEADAALRNDSPFHNFDIDANGLETDPIVGLNEAGAGNPWDGWRDNPQLPLPTTGIEYTWIASRVGIGGVSDGVVSYVRQYLRMASSASAELQQITGVAHQDQPGAWERIVDGLDEPDVQDRAYVVRTNTDYAGYITSQPSSSGTLTDRDDEDWYKVELTSDARVEVAIGAVQAQGETGVQRFGVYDAQGNLKLETTVSSLPDTLQVNLTAGPAFVRVAGKSSSVNVTRAPYRFRIEADTSLAVNIRSADAALRTVPGRPYVTASVDVTQGGQALPGLTASDFSVFENGSAVEEFSVTPPSQGGTRLADIVFLVDNSGSMGGEQADVRQNIRAFVDALIAENVDFALGLVRYGGENGGRPIIEENGALTRDASYFTNSVLTRNRTSGGTEPGYFALTEAIASFAFRPGSQKVFIIATDETPAQQTFLASEQEARDRLIDNDVTLYASTTSNLFGVFQRLTGPTGGEVFNILADFSSVAQRITTQVSSTYVITYQSPTRFSGAGSGTRELVIDASPPEGSGRDTTIYAAGTRPVAVTTLGTQQAARSGQQSSTALPIGIEVARFSGPSIQSVQLYYRTAGSTGPFASVPMAEQPDSTAGARKQITSTAAVYQADVPPAVVQEPGIEYYVTVSDGQSTVSVPSTDPRRTPYQFAVLPNEPPQIAHDVPDAAPVGEPFLVTATVTDATASVDEVTLFFRQRGELTYRSETMLTAGLDGYEAAIPASDVTDRGIEYYIRAVDQPGGIAATRGTADRPLSPSGEGATPTPRLPSADAIGVPASFTFRWNGVEGMQEYQVEVARAPTFDDASVQRFTLADTSTTVSNLAQGVQHYWRVRGRGIIGGYGPWSEASPFETYPETIDVSVRRSFETASQADEYRLVALPGRVSQQPALTGQQGTDWKIYRDTGADQDFLAPFDGSDAFRFRPGNGFWMLSTSEWSVDASGVSTIDLDATGAATIPLRPGWNIISNPLDRDASWADVEVANGGALQALWAFDGQFSRSDTFSSARDGSAYYFLNDTGQSELHIPYARGLQVDEASLRMQERGAPAVHTVEVVGGMHGEHRSTVDVGVHPDALPNRDAYDWVAPPAVFETVSIHAEAAAPTTKASNTGASSRTRFLARDVRPPERGGDGITYPIRLIVRDGSSVQIRLRSDALQKAPVSAALISASTGEKVRLHPQTYATIRPSVKTTRWVLAIGSMSYLDQAQREVLPAEVQLQPVYPNPARQSATIEYTLPRSEPVRLEVYDILGRRVAVLVDQMQKAGFHRLQWSGPGRDGALSSGMYFIQLSTSSATHVQKLAIVR